jgi:hypothetical protein
MWIRRRCPWNRAGCTYRLQTPTDSFGGSRWTFPPTQARIDRHALSAADVADMLDTLDATDLRSTIAELEDPPAMLRPGASVRDQLTAVDSETFKAALILRTQRALARRARPVRR